MDKLLWVSLPLGLATMALAWLAWRGRMPSRPVLNAWLSLLLLGYVLATAGLGIFWVANQHLPVFDWHYLFGYALLLLLAVHLAFNLRALMHHLRRPPARPAAPVAAGRRPLLGAVGVVGVAGAGGIGYLVGLRHGRTELRIGAAAPGAADAAAATALAVVHEFHAFSSHTRTGVLRRAPSAEWGAVPPPFKRLPAVGQVVLPPPRSSGGTGVDLALLADALWHAAGVSLESGGIHFRTSPSSGALFATELYVAARRIPGLDPGLWHYDVPEHALRRVTAGSGLAGLGADDWPADAAALIIATAVFRRSGHKYRDRTYRYVLGDLGHLLENLRIVAGAAGARAALLTRLDESRIARALAIDESDEGVLSALSLQDRTAPARPPDSAARSSGWAPPQLAGASDALLGITEAVHRATSMRGPHAVQFAGPKPVADSTPPPSSAMGLPAVTSRMADPRRHIRARRSIRRYADLPLALDDVAALLASMVRPGALLSHAVNIDLVAHDVAGLRTGAWRYHPAAHALEPRRAGVEGLRQRSRAAALDQDVIGDAAAVFVLAIDREAFINDDCGAARGYRHAFIESGLMGERLYLEAGARGLGCCAVGAFYDEEAAALVGGDPERRWIVHFAAVGRLRKPAG